MVIEMIENDLKDRLESTLITRTFNISGMPVKEWEKVDMFCKENFGDSRWTMLSFLIKQAEEDWKYRILQEEIEDIKIRIEELKTKTIVPEKEQKKIRTFGG